jgi:hypothetical protein
MLASSPMRATSAEFRYNFVERFDNDLPVMTKLRTRVRTLARKLKPTRVAPERCARLVRLTPIVS